MPDCKSLIVLLGLSICATEAIRNLKEGPIIGPESRQYKVLSLPNEGPTDDITNVSSIRAAPVQLFCTERSMIVLISADLRPNSRHVTAEEFSLGRSTKSCKASQRGDTEYIIKADLHQCGSKLSIDGDHLVYSNQLIYTPIPSSFGIVRKSGVSIPIACHYKRTYFVSSIDVKPSWNPFTSTKSAVKFIRFSFDLMNDDWRTKRSSYVYHLGEVMNIQAAFVMTGHAPFRLVMDSCVVTLEPNGISLPRYIFVQNHGCLVDSKASDSSARFMPRKQNNVLQMQMAAFRFHKDPRNAIYITCQPKIVDLDLNIMNKACTHFGNRWLSVDGWHEVCVCCENTCDGISQKLTGKWNGLPKRSGSRDTDRGIVLLCPTERTQSVTVVFCCQIIFTFIFPLKNEDDEETTSAVTEVDNVGRATECIPGDLPTDEAKELYKVHLQKQIRKSDMEMDLIQLQMEDKRLSIKKSNSITGASP